MTRRHAVRNFLMWAAASPLARPQQPPTVMADRLPALEDMLNVFDFEAVARTKVPKSTFDYITPGADNEWTLRRNREMFEKILLRPRVLTDVSKLDVSCELFVIKVEMPILLSPTGTLGQAHPDGELATARAAGAAKTIMCVSSNSSFPIDKIGAAATGPLWFQLYAVEDLDLTRERVERAVAAGCKVIAFTVDSQFPPQRERMLRNRTETASTLLPAAPGVTVPGRPPAAPARRSSAPERPLQYRMRPALTAQLTWSFLGTLKGWAKTPVLVKGILTPEDARLCVERGADGLIVSNHGARRLDTVPSTIEVLPDIVDAVGGKIPVLIDGGFRRGTDVLKALAIGAKAVMVGRPHFWGLGAFGQVGVQRVLELLQTELARAMGFAGRPNLASLDRNLVKIER